MNMGDRRKIMEVIKDSPRALLANAKCLTEGVNLPSVDCVAFLSPKRSRIDVAQAMGRGMRQNGGSKKLGYVIVPLYIALAEGESYDEAIKRARFDTVLEVLQTLKEMDESFTDFLKELAQPKRRAKGSSDWRLSEHVEFIAPTVLLEQLVSTIRLESIDGLIPSLERRLAELDAYKEANGHCNVPCHGSSLGMWLSNLRALYSNGKLAQDLIDRLNAMGVSWDVYSDLLEQRFAELVSFKEANGHCNPPANGELGQWCQNQRDKYANGLLESQLIERLEALGFCWNLRRAAFRKFIVDLTEFKAANGHCNPHCKTPLGRRCAKIRSAKKAGKDLGLSDENIAELLALGFSFNDPRMERRKQFIAELTKFKAEYGHCDLPSGTPLPKQAQVIRQYKQHQILNDDEIAQLEALGFCWNMHDVARKTLHEKFIADLSKFKAEHGHCNVPCGEKSARNPLAERCNKMRIYYKKGRLTSQEIAEIEALGFCWELEPQRIRKHRKTVADLVKFKAENGHCNVPARNDSLGQRCRTLREIKETLLPDIIADLNALGFCWDSPREVRRKSKSLMH